MSFDPNLANTLPNGATILGRRRTGSSWAWLCYWQGHATPYVTWLSNQDSPGDTYWGHYFNSLEKATEDYVNRCESLVCRD